MTPCWKEGVIQLTFIGASSCPWLFVIQYLEKVNKTPIVPQMTLQEEILPFPTATRVFLDRSRRIFPLRIFWRVRKWNTSTGDTEWRWKTKRTTGATSQTGPKAIPLLRQSAQPRGQRVGSLSSSSQKRNSPKSTLFRAFANLSGWSESPVFKCRPFLAWGRVPLHLVQEL